MKDLIQRINESTSFIKDKIVKEPEIGLILGSGLGTLADEIEDKTYLSYNDIPNFPVSTVEGHAGRFVAGCLEGKNVIAMQGRFHYYEGYNLEEVTFPIRIMKELGVKTIIVTNAAGGVNKSFKPGDLMLITDHINFGFDNPLIGRNYKKLGVRFPDTSQAYDKKLINIVKDIAKESNIDLKEGTYTFFTGPTYETPAEIRMASFIGSDAVGMSTVPEVMVAVHSSLKVIGISCITNMAAGILDQPLHHDEVVETASKVRNTFTELVKNIINKL